MSTLRLRVNKYLDSEGGSPPEVFARIISLDPDTGGNIPATKMRQELIPISDRPGAARSIDVMPGHYFVEVSLPSGELLADDVRVPAESDVDLVLEAEASPHEWLSWQHLMGNVDASSVTRPWAYDLTGRLMSFSLPVIDVGEPIHWLTKPLPGLASGVRPIEGWRLINELKGTPVELIRSLNSSQDTLSIKPYMTANLLAVYRIVHGTRAVNGATALRSDLRRDFVVIKRSESVELVSLPTPWNVIESGREAVVEIVVQEPRRSNDFATSVAVCDERLGLLLGYLSSGALPAVQQFAETAREMLYTKFENELAAVAGAYALIGTEYDTTPKEWHTWVRNLMERFPHVPDGAIQLATLKLRMQRTMAERNEAIEALRVAFQRGLPYYSLGVRWLLEGLERIASDDPEAASMHGVVRSVAWRIHPLSPFTIVQLGNH